MINDKLFYALAGISARQKQIPNTPRLIAPWTTTSYRYLEEGFAYEFYLLEDETETVSWFWRPGDFIIPTSPYSNIVISEGSETVEYSYGDAIRELRANKDMRKLYNLTRTIHNSRIEQRINDIITLSPFRQYVSLKETGALAFEYLTEEQIASYINTNVSELRRFMNKDRLIANRYRFVPSKDWLKKPYR